MTKAEIEKIKKDGMREKLLSLISGKLWYVKMATERASIDHCKNFSIEVNKAIKALDDAKQLFEEASKI